MKELLTTSKLGTWSSNTLACADPSYIDQLWVVNNPISIGDIVYNTNAQTSPFNGGNYYFGVRFAGIPTAQTIQIATNGQVMNIPAACTPPGAFGSVNMVLGTGAPIHVKQIGDVYWNSIDTLLPVTVSTDGPTSTSGVLISNDLDVVHTFRVPITGTADSKDYIEFIDSLGASEIVAYTGPGNYDFIGKTITSGGIWRVNLYTDLTPIYTLKTLTVGQNAYHLELTMAIENNTPSTINPLFTITHNSIPIGTATFSVNSGVSNLYTTTVDLIAPDAVIGYEFNVTEATDSVTINFTKTLDYNDASVVVKAFGPYFTANYYYPLVNQGMPNVHCGTSSSVLLFCLDKLDLGRFYPVYDPVTFKVTGVYEILTVTTAGVATTFDASAVSYVICMDAAQSPPL